MIRIEALDSFRQLFLKNQQWIVHVMQHKTLGVCAGQRLSTLGLSANHEISRAGAAPCAKSCSVATPAEPDGLVILRH